MKLCLACEFQFSPSSACCPRCGAPTPTISGFDAYAPELAHSGGGFNAGHFADLARLEGRNFWFRARNEAIIWALTKYGPDCKSFLEIGCGTGFVLSGLVGSFPQVRLEGSEIFADGLAFASARLPGVKLMQMDARRIPFVEEYDAIGAFDVLEHIKEDEMVLREMHKALMPGGLLLASVPQHRWLWSSMDELACHQRRYAASELQGKVISSGFEILKSTSFVSILLPAMLLSRLLKRNTAENSADPMAELDLLEPLNTLLFQALRIELGLIKQGFSFPFGGSRLVVARKI
jgi:SAM-dependent methyltransferase